jgi:prolyl-tRNA editing enzyme YbaK/EbsC (Cys-tRNA(Pro) deacylase)
MTSEDTTGTITTTRVEAIIGFLDGMGIPYELVEHAPVMSAGAEAHAAQLPPDQVAKTVVLHDGRAYVIVAIPACDRLSLGKLRGLLGATRQLRLASEAEMARDFPTLEVGAVPPFGPIVPAAEVLDSALVAQERILCPAGDHRHSVLVDPRDIVRITGAEIAAICED